jgi:hypothetical protein
MISLDAVRTRNQFERGPAAEARVRRLRPARVPRREALSNSVIASCKRTLEPNATLQGPVFRYRVGPVVVAPGVGGRTPPPFRPATPGDTLSVSAASESSGGRAAAGMRRSVFAMPRFFGQTLYASAADEL